MFTNLFKKKHKSIITLQVAQTQPAKIRVLKFVTYIYSDAKFNRQNTSKKSEIEHPGTKEEQANVDQVKPISANHITLRWSRVKLPVGVRLFP